MRFVDDIHLHGEVERGKARLVDERAHILHTGVGGSIQLDDVHAARLRDSAARAFAAGLPALRVFAVQRLCEDLRRAGLACAARAGEQVRMRHMPFLNLVLENGGDMFLPDHVLKTLGAVFSV